ncbi:MAG: hypothetical protein QNJ85_02720 [Gammaproteobacteria bacterium]|nr:hypothetical protein [Gammaproteobacteria bacterium]
MTTNVISLGELRGDDSFPAFAAIYAPDCDNPFVLSPAAMRWSDDIHLNRLGDCRQFWQAQKKKLRVKLAELFESLLRQAYGDQTLAVFGRHPWQCLLYLYYQRQHAGRGLFLLQSPLDQNIYRSLDWDQWFAPQDELARHWQEIAPRGYNPEQFRARQARLKRFVERIGVATPAAMSSAGETSITRRFDRWLGRIWHWTFQQDSDLARFPWRHYAQPRRPRVERELEYPVNQWQYIALLLREDLARLAQKLPRDDATHVNRMCWEIALFNDRRIEVELSFRHPYCLHRDAPNFDTALYQARYLYDDLMRELSARESDLDLPEAMPFVGWKIDIRECLQLTPQLWDLFARDVENLDYRRIQELQNKLPLAFESYRFHASFFPEDSFGCAPIGMPLEHDYEALAWTDSAVNKPLFFYRDVIPIPCPGRLQKIFLERNSNQWWLDGDALRSIRDYYLLRDRRGRCSWVYRDADGAWFKQGEFS